MESKKPAKLLDQVRQKIRFLHYSRKTEQAYVHWIRRYILFHGKRHPKEMGAEEISGFLNYLVNRENIAASTQNQALNALMFLYKQVLNMEPDDLPQYQYARKPKRLPVVLTSD